VDYPDRIGTFRPLPNLLKIFTEYERWGNILNLSYVASLNQKVENFEINEIIQVSEALQKKKSLKLPKRFIKKEILELLF